MDYSFLKHFDFPRQLKPILLIILHAWQLATKN